MVDNTKPLANPSLNNQHFATDVDERPLNPTTNAADFLGDTSGLTGITQGSPSQVGAEPSERSQEDSFLRGGGSLNTKSHATGIPKEAVSDEVYDKNTSLARSDVSLRSANDKAEEPEKGEDDTQTTHINQMHTTEGDSISLPHLMPETSSREDVTNHPQEFNSPSQQPEIEGESWVGGDMPDPESDDDTLANVQAMGMQLEEDEEHPQELDLARDIDRAEQAVHE